MALPISTAATSCVPIEMQLKDLDSGSVVIVGTVAARDALGVRVQVKQWFSGADPRDGITIPLPGPNEPIIVGTWDPKPGERWFIIGERTGAERVESNVCRQSSVDPNVLTVATEVFGPPSLPPFSSPDNGTDEPASGPPMALGIALLVLGVAAGIAAVVLLQRRPARTPASPAQARPNAGLSSAGPPERRPLQRRPARTPASKDSCPKHESQAPTDSAGGLPFPR